MALFNECGKKVDEMKRNKIKQNFPVIFKIA